VKRIVVLVTLVGCAAFLGRGAATMLAPQVEPPRVDLRGVARVEPPPPRDPSGILLSGLFPSPEQPPVEEPHGPELASGLCQGTMRLVGTVVREGGSFAAIAATSGASSLYNEGMRIDRYELVTVQSDRVLLRPEEGALCVLPMFAGDRSLQPAPPPPPVEPGPAVDGIRQLGEDRFEVDRALVERLVSGAAAMELRVAFPERDGRVLGAQLFGIRRGSVWDRLGLRNGDVLRHVNGHDLSGPDGMIAAFGALRAANELTLHAVRRGAPIVIEYRIAQ
jgi:general secretion pathway protein C